MNASRRDFMRGLLSTTAAVTLPVPLLAFDESECVINPAVVDKDIVAPPVDLLERIYEDAYKRLVFEMELPWCVNLGGEEELHRLSAFYDQPVPSKSEIDEIMCRFPRPVSDASVFGVRSYFDDPASRHLRNGVFDVA